MQPTKFSGGEFLERIRNDTLTLVSSPALLAELAEVIERPKFDAILTRSNTSRERSLAEIQALAAQVDFIVSGDNDLLDLKTFEHRARRGAAEDRGVAISLAPSATLMRLTPYPAIAHTPI